MNFFNIDHIAFSFWNYPVSYVEMIGTVFGFISVYLASRNNIITWPTGIINEVFLLVLFFQVHLYADMFLQIYFLFITIYGWHYWGTNAPERSISTMTFRERLFLILAIGVVSMVIGVIIRDIHIYLPACFPIKAAYPFADSLVTVFSISATFLLAKKKIENWILWLIADVISIVLFFKKEIYFLSLEYVIFLFMASYGLYNWKHKIQP